MVGLITIEQLPDSDATYIIRGCKKYGDPYDMVCTAIATGDTVMIKGMHGTIDLTTRRDIGRCFRDAGYKKMTFERYRKNGKITSHEILLDKEYDGAV